jgi:DnaJ domain
MAHPGPGRNPGDPYHALGVSAGASQREIARAYRQAAQRAHPDARPHDRQAAARFQALTDAYDLLSDPGRRAAYDRGHPADQPSSQPPPSRQPAAAPRRRGWPLPPGQLIWAGPVRIEPPATAPATTQPRRPAPAAEWVDPVVILGVRPGQVWGWW